MTTDEFSKYIGAESIAHPTSTLRLLHRSDRNGFHTAIIADRVDVYFMQSHDSEKRGKTVTIQRSLLDEITTVLLRENIHAQEKERETNDGGQ